MEHTASAAPGADRARKRRRKRQRGVIEHPPGSGQYAAQYFCRGCDKHVATAPKAKRRHRERAGSKSLAADLYIKRKNEIREGRFFPAPTVWDPPLVTLRDGVLGGHAADYLVRHRSALVDVDGEERYARYFALAPETKGKSMRQVTPQDFERYRERRRQEGAPGARRHRGAASVSTAGKELSFARKVYYDFIAACEDRGIPAMLNPARQRRRTAGKPLFPKEPEHRVRWLSEDEEARLQAAMAPAEWPKVLVALHTGLDRGAQFSLRWDAVAFTTRTIHAVRRKGRASEPREFQVPINDELLAVLRGLPSRGRSPWVFPNTSGTGPADGREFDRLVFQPALVKARINLIRETRTCTTVRAGAGVREVEKVHREVHRTFRWKDLRHSFATRLREKGADTGTIRDLLAHTSDRMTARYAHASADLLLAAVQRISRNGTGDAGATTGAISPDPSIDGAESEHVSVEFGR